MKKVASLLNLLTVTLCISVIAAGCAGLGKGPSDEELIRGTLEKMKTALETKNIDMLMETVSNNFNHPEVGGKEEARKMLQLGLDMGYAEGGKVSLENTQITIDKDGTARAFPIDLSSNMGAVAAEVVLTKEKGQWLVTTVNVD